MKNKFLTLAGCLGFAALSFYACDDKIETGGDCDYKSWVGTIFTPTTILEVVPQDRQMSIQGENISGLIADVYQPNITGNFEAIAEFDKFYFTGADATQAIPYLEMYIKNYTQPDSIADPTSISCKLTPYGFVTKIGTAGDAKTFSLPLPTEFKGSLRVGRMNGKLIASAIMGADTLTQIVPAALGTTTQQVGFRFGAEIVGPSGAVTTAGVKINKFNVVSTNNGTNLLSDEFLCKSINFVLP